MSDDKHGNGEARKLIWWILGILSAIAMGASTFLTTSALARVTKLEEAKVVQEVAVAVLKTEQSAVIQRLDRIEQKLDLVLSRARATDPER